MNRSGALIRAPLLKPGDVDSNPFRNDSLMRMSQDVESTCRTSTIMTTWLNLFEGLKAVKGKCLAHYPSSVPYSQKSAPKVC